MTSTFATATSTLDKAYTNTRIQAYKQEMKQEVRATGVKW